MFDVVAETSGSAVVVNLKGELTIQHVGELKAVFLDTLEKSEHLVVNIAEKAEIEFSCLQLFCSLHKEAVKRQKDIELFYRGNQSFKDLALHAGYFRRTGCTLDRKKRCLWLGGVHE